MNFKLKAPLLFTLLFLIYVLFSYSFLGDWLFSSIGSLLIILLSYLIWDKSFFKQIGLQLNLLTIVKAILLAVLLAACSLLNEEIVLGAILLFAIVRKWKIRPLLVSLYIAILFSLLHYIFYKWIFSESGILGISTLITLFLVGFVRNSLIIQTGHIGYSWALHFGWIAIMFGSGHVYKDSYMYFSEPECFNKYLGSTEMLIISIILAGFFIAYWIIKPNPHQVPMRY